MICTAVLWSTTPDLMNTVVSKETLEAIVEKRKLPIPVYFNFDLTQTVGVILKWWIKENNQGATQLMAEVEMEVDENAEKIYGDGFISHELERILNEHYPALGGLPTTTFHREDGSTEQVWDPSTVIASIVQAPKALKRDTWIAPMSYSIGNLDPID